MKFRITGFAIVLVVTLNAQSKLRPGFDGNEYADLLSLTFFSKINKDSMPESKSTHQYTMIYRSTEVGFVNRWTFYLRDDNVGIIDLRGTVNQSISWLANFYAAMIPATGSLQLNDSTKFDYQLSSDPRAAVHVGWTVSIGHLAPDIVKHIKEYYLKSNIKEYIISGHSQGGALSFLMRSYLEYEKQKGNIPGDVLFKTYCSAAPKPGNMYYAYDFDFITRNGWAFTIVNTSDWVPETPFSMQQVKDLNEPNPLNNVSAILNKQSMLVRLTGKSIYGKMERKPRKAQRTFEKYLGHSMYKRAVKKALPEFKEPGYSHIGNYMRAGVPIVLRPYKEYEALFPTTPKGFFTHHSFAAYYKLVAKYYLQ